MPNSWKLSRPVFGLLMYFTTKNVFATAIFSQSQVISNSVTAIIHLSMVSLTVTVASNISIIQANTTIEAAAPATTIIQTTVGGIAPAVSANQTVLQTLAPTTMIVAVLNLTSMPTLGQTPGNFTTSVVSVASPTSLLATTSAPNTTAATTAAPNTTAATTTYPTVNPANYHRTVKFAFPGNCSDFYNSSTEKAFKEHLKTSIASKANLNVSNMNDFNLTCGSIVVRFILVPDASNSSAPSVNDSITSLSNLIQSGNLQITFNGRNLTADKTSLVITIISPPTTVVPTTTVLKPTPTPTRIPTPTPTSSPFTTGVIIGIVIGCIVGCLAILILVYWCFCRKNSVVSEEPSELQHTIGKRQKMASSDMIK